MDFVRTLLLSSALSIAPAAHTATLQFDFDVFVDAEELEFGCGVEPVDDFYCIPNVQGGDRSRLTISLDTLSRVSSLPEEAGWWPPDEMPSGGAYAIWNSTLETRTGPYRTHEGVGGVWDGFLTIDIRDGDEDLFIIYGPSDLDSEWAGAVGVRLSDSTGTAISALDLSSEAAVSNWLLNRFSASLFDSGTWYTSTYDGGGGAWGRVSVPEPSMGFVLLASLLGFTLVSRARRRSSEP